ncbi:MAG: NYN domain-containing protein [Magnetococcales bacterium]|nr:NYN domain-containing protein [Magnetococcales bacterium]
MTRVIACIDGFNLYFGLRSKGWRRYYWLDLAGLSQSLLKPGHILQSVHYFTARIRANGRNNEDMRRQNTYLEALATRPDLHTHFGHYLEKKRECHLCGAQWLDYEEKMTDVNIAVQMLNDVCEDRFDTALLVSGDSDLTPPLDWVRSRYPTKRVVVALPPGRHSVQLTRAAGGYLTIGEDKLRQNSLPDTITRTDGYLLTRPDHWR